MEERGKEEERLMVQNLTDGSFKKVCIDSGQGRASVQSMLSQAMS